MAIKYNREWDYFGDFSEVPEIALDDPKNKRCKYLSAKIVSLCLFFLLMCVVSNFLCSNQVKR